MEYRIVKKPLDQDHKDYHDRELAVILKEGDKELFEGFLLNHQYNDFTQSWEPRHKDTFIERHPTLSIWTATLAIFMLVVLL